MSGKKVVIDEKKAVKEGVKERISERNSSKVG
jgi:hypothetical protein